MRGIVFLIFLTHKTYGWAGNSALYDKPRFDSIKLRISTDRKLPISMMCSLQEMHQLPTRMILSAENKLAEPWRQILGNLSPTSRNFCVHNGGISRREIISLAMIFLGAKDAHADVQLTYGSGSFSGSSVVNGILSAYGLPQLPDTKGFTPFLSQYQVISVSIEVRLFRCGKTA